MTSDSEIFKTGGVTRGCTPSQACSWEGDRGTPSQSYGQETEDRGTPDRTGDATGHDSGVSPPETQNRG